jgi:urea carboxylase
MEGPGGYQLVGRTIQMWNRWRSTGCFDPGKPWLLRFFDRIRFYPVSGEELAEARDAFPHGGYPLRVEPGRFALAEHEEFLAANRAGISRFKARQQKAFEAERQRWREQGLDRYVAEETDTAGGVAEEILPAGLTAVHAPTAANVWKIEVAPGARVSAGQVMLVVESMKMEIAITAPATGILRELRCAPGRAVKAGQVLAVIGTDP